MTVFALELRGIHKVFGGTVALGGVDFFLRPGSVHALLGENGAGKTTLMRVAFGLVTPDRGEIRSSGAPVTVRSPADAMRAWIGMVQQHFTLVPALTSLENVALGWSSSRGMREGAVRLAAATGLRFEPDTTVAELSVADQQRVELLKALTRGARMLILDEPTAALAPAETDHLFAWLGAFRDRGGSVVLITHKLDEAMSLADDITVLRRGSVTWSGSRRQANIDILVPALIGGSESATDTALATGPRGRGTDTVIAESIVVKDDHAVVRLRDVSLRLSSGEFVGVAGVEGSGIVEFMYVMAGRLTPSSGRLQLPDEMGFIPEDRHRDALLIDASIAENLALRSANLRRGWLSRRGLARRAERLVAAGDVRVSSVRSGVDTLSGGNQQRLVLTRELDGDPPLVVAMNPTRGLDLKAARNIRDRLRGAVTRGATVLYSSADLDELLEVVDRVLVVFNGGVREVPLDRDAIGRAMLGTA